MAKYLITSGTEVMNVVKAKSIREAIEGMNVEGEGEFVVYTVTSQRTVQFETVKETKLTIAPEGSTDENGEDGDEDKASEEAE